MQRQITRDLHPSSLKISAIFKKQYCDVLEEAGLWFFPFFAQCFVRDRTVISALTWLLFMRRICGEFYRFLSAKFTAR